jgi:DNA repair exonuclease SbcCD ATPase subunit
MKIKSVKINNILSIEDAFIEFDDNGLMLVQGWNHDVGRANGAGKTAIFNAITFALFDKLPRKITATEILRRGSKAGYVELCLEVGTDQYVVRRSRPKGVTFQKAVEPLTITQEGWERILGLNYDQFVISMYAAQGAATRFLSINDSEKKQFLLQLLNLEEFSSCKIIADRKVKLLEDEFTASQSRIDTIDSKVDAYGESLVDENNINHFISLGNQAIVDLTAKIVEAKRVVKPDLSKFQKLEDDIAAKKTEFTKIKTRREMLHEQYKKVKAKQHTFSGSDRCAACGTSLDISAAKAAHERELAERCTEMAQIKQQIDSCDDALTNEKSIADLSIRVREKKAEESRDFDTALSTISELQTKITLKHRELKELNLKLQNNSELQSKIKDLLTMRDKIVDNRASILRNIELYKTVSAMYSPTGAQAYILDSVIESFNERVADYVKLLWSNMTYELKSYKETVKGDVTAKFSEHLIMDGKSISMGSLSGGEFRALSLCVDFALIEVMERQFGLSLSPIILDEPFDGLDGSGRELIIELLEEMAVNRQVVIIDHASEVAASFSNVLMVEKRDGISTICKST